jgi:UDP-N-acetylglucosamine 1-carboxyvinyltransferase
MGADVLINGRTAVVKGVRELYGARVTARDLRGGAALALAGLRAKGETVIEQARLIDRGYEQLETALSSLGAEIVRERYQMVDT